MNKAEAREPDTLSFPERHGPQLINDSACFFRSSGDKIYYRKWGNPGSDENLKILLVLHGIGFHSYPYRKIMSSLDSDSILVYALDLPGHGLSGKSKGVIESNGKILSAVDSMIYIIKRDNPYAHTYLLGVSMGGVYALDYAIHNSTVPQLSGLILAGAALKLHRSQIIQIDDLLYIFPFLFNRHKPVVNLDGKRLECSCNDKEYIKARRNDSLSIHYVSIDYLTKILKVQRECKKKSLLAGISLPVLILHGGEDKISSLKGSYYLNKNLTNARTDLIIYPESKHSLFWDSDSVNTVRDIVHWLSKQ